MLEKKTIAKGLFLIATNFGFEVRQEYAELVGTTLQEASTEQFHAAVESFLLKKSRFAMPTMAEWMEACGVETIANLQEQECYTFLNKVTDYFASFKSDEDKREFAARLSPLEKRVLQMHGGISELAWSVHSDNEYRRSTAKVIAELRTTFNDMYRLTPRLENINLPMQEQIKKLTSSIFGKIS